jgi:hypothetical protein
MTMSFSSFCPATAAGCGRPALRGSVQQIAERATTPTSRTQVSVLRQPISTMFMLVVMGLFGWLPAPCRAAAGLDCPEPGAVNVPNILQESLRDRPMAAGNTIDLANEINELITMLQIQNPSISYADLTNVMIAAFCPIVANMADLSVSEKWDRMRQFDRVLQQQIAANMVPPGTLIIANVPLSPTVYRELKRQAAAANQTPAQFMAAILTKATGK